VRGDDITIPLGFKIILLIPKIVKDVTRSLDVPMSPSYNTMYLLVIYCLIPYPSLDAFAATPKTVQGRLASFSRWVRALGSS
jgi:hypothetical protein